MQTIKLLSSTASNNQNKDSEHELKQHFFITQVQNLLLQILITVMMQFSNHLAVYLIYCCPMYFLIMYIQWLVFWKPKPDRTKCFNIINGIMFLICVPIFFGVFFAVFHPTASLNFKQAQNCQMIGQLSNWIESTEKYSILYINFEYEGQQYLGQACASNFFQAKTTSLILPYKFYYKNDYMECGPTDGNRTSPQYHRLLPQYSLNQTEINSNRRILKSRSSSRSSSRSRTSSRSTSSSSSSSSPGSCYRTYTWSKVKIASWLCQDNDFDVEDYMEPQDCYVNFFNGNKAFQSGILRSALKDQYNFPLVAYQSHAYFPQADLVCLILFSYYNWILSFNSLFLYTTNYILQQIKKFKKKMITLELLSKHNANPIQLYQTNQELQNMKPKINQIDQPLINVVVNNQIPQPQQIQYPALPPNQYQQQLNFLPQINQVQTYTLGEVAQQPNLKEEDNILKSPQVHIEIQNPMKEQNVTALLSIGGNI